jgi:hypothetical protein
MQARFKLPASVPAGAHTMAGTPIQPGSPTPTPSPAAGGVTKSAAAQPSVPPREVLSTDHNPLKASALYKLHPRMQEAQSALSFIGFV